MTSGTSRCSMTRDPWRRSLVRVTGWPGVELDPEDVVDPLDQFAPALKCGLLRVADRQLHPAAALRVDFRERQRPPAMTGVEGESHPDAKVSRTAPDTGRRGRQRV
jgi:hypothetical protein